MDRLPGRLISLDCCFGTKYTIWENPPEPEKESAVTYDPILNKGPIDQVLTYSEGEQSNCFLKAVAKYAG